MSCLLLIKRNSRKNMKLNNLTEIDDLIRGPVRQVLASALTSKANLEEAYVTQAKAYDLPTEMLSDKNKIANLDILNNLVDTTNRVSAELDVAKRDEANSESSEFRSLKLDEAYNVNNSFLMAMHFENVSDMSSTIGMDSLAFMRLERDFGTFDAWQQDFIACAMSCRSGFAITVYSNFLQRYINLCVDDGNQNILTSCIPVIVLNCRPTSYFRDYLNDRRAYVFAMMKELNWDTVEGRIKKADKVAEIMKK